MKRKRLLFAAIALIAGALSINAQTWEPSEVGAGSFYFYNVGAKGYMVAGNNWGTRASISPQGGILTTLVGSESAYEIQTSPSFSGRHLGHNGYVDNDAANQIWTFEAVEGESNVYKLKTSAGDYLFADAGATTTTVGADPGTDYAKWKLVTRENRIADLANASMSNPIDATFLLTNPNFDRNSNKGVWSMEASNQNLSGGTNENCCAESYHSVFTLSQKTVSVPKGLYRLSAQGFYRQDGSDNENLPYIYINDTKVGTFKARTGTENDMSAVSTSFAKGNYPITGDLYELTENGTLTIGAKLETNTNLWCIWDNFTILYYGEKPANLAWTSYQAALSAAQAVDQEAKMYPETLTALQNALSQYGSLTESSSEEDLTAATSALSSATTAANASITAYATANIPAYLAKMATGLANTNVYTEEAYNKWYGNVQDIYDACGYTDEEVATLTADGAFRTGTNTWHVANHLDEILLSTWTIGGAQAADYTTPLYINTWSVEGDSDGSDFHAPFFEYWTGDDQSLGANTLVSTMTGLKPNTTYSFTIRARVRQTNGQTKIANGITMQVGDGTAIDISAGAQFNGGVFFIGNFSAVGTTDAEGNLITTITVAANSNISWLSFYNCMVTEGEDLSAYIADYEFALGNVNTALTDDVAYAAMQADLQAAAETYAKGNVDETSKEDLIAAKEALESALAAYNATVAPLKGNSIDGWTSTPHETGQFHVNTWSGEGATDGSNMITPFTEYWRNKTEGTLEDATMSYTVTGLTPGYYKVTALVRTLKETGGTTPEGSFIFANDNIERAYGANASDCTNGVYGNPVVYGLVGADGNLTIGIKVINANFNWVSWKNFVYEFVGTDLTTEIAANQTEEAREFANENKAKADQAAAIDALATLSDANYTAAGQAIEAAYRANDNVVVTIGAAEYTTFVTPYATSTPAGVTAYVVPAFNKNKDGEITGVALSAVTDIPANTPVILNGEAGSYEFAVLEGEPEAIDPNLLKASDGTIEGDEATIYALAKKDVVGFYPVKTGAKVPAGKAYIEVTESTSVKGFIALDDAVADAINNIAAETANGEIFNIAGQKVQNITKGGLYIVNGKKVVVK